ncbi:MAG: helix-turn-helix domain-containing protein [Nocardioides sp.]|nr:helix-turn-helix domain-containing protein [Nocardioides sp.]
MSPPSQDFAAELASLRDRVTRLEEDAATSPDPDTFWALEGLRARRAEHPATADGVVLLTGSLTLPTGEPVEWQQAGATASLLEEDWSERAVSLAALSHPVRLDLLRRVLGGTRTTAGLADELGSTGQLHHHLRQLVAAGWLRQRGRGAYEVPAARVVPLLVVLTAVQGS